MPANPAISLKIVERPDSINVVDQTGVVVAYFDASHRKDAEAFVMLPRAILLLDSTVDGAEGYVCEVGDGDRYWQAGILEAARSFVDRLLPWARGDEGRPAGHAGKS